jgi:hypothetical protein
MGGLLTSHAAKWNVGRFIHWLAARTARNRRIENNRAALPG